MWILMLSIPCLASNTWLIGLWNTQNDNADTIMEKTDEDTANIQDINVGIDSTTYKVAKEEILSLLPLKAREIINNWFTQLERLINEDEWKDTPEERLKIIERIDYIISNITSPNNSIEYWQIAEDDYLMTVRPDLCKIAESLDVISTVCSEYIKDDQDKKIIDNKLLDFIKSEKPADNSNSFVIVILWIAIFASIGFILASAIKAKSRKKSKNEDK